MKRLLPAPLLSVALFLLWLLLTRSLSAGHLILATVLALAVPLLTRGLRPLPVRYPQTHRSAAPGAAGGGGYGGIQPGCQRILVFPSRRHYPRLCAHTTCRVRNALAVLAMIVCTSARNFQRPLAVGF